MTKVYYSIIKYGKYRNFNLKGYGYIKDEDLVIEIKNQDGNLEEKVFEDVFSSCYKKEDNQYKGHYNEFVNIQFENQYGSIIEKEIEVDYQIWFKILN